MLSQRGGLDMDRAFAVLRGYARDHNLRLTEVARAVVNRKLPPELLLGHAATRAEHRSRPTG